MLNIANMLSDCRWELARIEEAIRRLEEVSQAPRIRRGRYRKHTDDHPELSWTVQSIYANSICDSPIAPFRDSYSDKTPHGTWGTFWTLRPSFG
jgi:hypothetical protein